MNTLKTFSFLFLTFILLHSCYVAPDSGHWKGDVVYKNALGRMSLCQQELDLNHTDEILHIHRLEVRCPGFSSSWYPSIFSIDRDRVYYQGRQIGDAKENGSVFLGLEETEYSPYFPSYRGFMHVSWTIQGNRLLLEQKIFREGTEESISGWLVKSI